MGLKKKKKVCSTIPNFFWQGVAGSSSQDNRDKSAHNENWLAWTEYLKCRVKQVHGTQFGHGLLWGNVCSCFGKLKRKRLNLYCSVVNHDWSRQSATQKIHKFSRILLMEMVCRWLFSVTRLDLKSCGKSDWTRIELVHSSVKLSRRFPIFNVETLDRVSPQINTHTPN